MQRPQPQYSPIPFGIKLLSYATGIRWIGWGFCEALVPVLIYSITKNYALSGLLYAIPNILFLLLLPFGGILADRMRIKTFLMVGLGFFILSGVLLMAGAYTDRLIFIVLGNTAAGAALISDLIGRSTYIRRQTSSGAIASAFGFSTAFVNSGQLAGIFLGALLAPHVPFYIMFSLVAPTTVVTMILLALYLTDDKAPGVPPGMKGSLKIIFRQFMGDHLLRSLGGTFLFLNLLDSLGLFFLPVLLRTTGASTRAIVLAGAVYYFPFTFSFILGKLADRREIAILKTGWLCTALLLFGLSVASRNMWYVTLTFILLALINLMSLAVESLVTERIDAAFYGRFSSLFEGCKQVGIIIGPVIIGLLFQLWGKSMALLVMSIVIFILYFLYIVHKRFAV